MAFKKELKLYKKFFILLNKKRIRLYVFLAILLYCLFLPPTFIYSFGNLPQKPPIVKELDMTIPSPQPYPVNVKNTPSPYFSARSIIVVDVDSKAILFFKNPDEELMPASTTKMVTALVARNLYKPEDVVTVKNPEHLGQVMELYQDEKITVKALLYGTLVQSGNDAAYALADFHPRGRGAFINEMNDYVKNLGLEDSHFTNPAGIDNGKHYSTVHDLALIAAEIIKDPMLSEIVATENIIVTDFSGEFMHNLETTNKLLNKVSGVKGIKTGWTEYAGECLVTLTERDNHRVITAMLGSYDRFGETEKLIKWIFENYQWQEIDWVN